MTLLLQLPGQPDGANSALVGVSDGLLRAADTCQRRIQRHRKKQRCLQGYGFKPGPKQPDRLSPTRRA
jgi:hypothetical protein